MKKLLFTFSGILLCLLVFGGVFETTLPDQSHMARAYRATSNQSIVNNAADVIEFNAEDYDAGSEFDIATNVGRFTPTRAGYYLGSTALHFAASATGVRGVDVYKNGAVYADGPRGPAAAAGITKVAFVTVVYLDGNTDYAEIMAFQNTGGVLNLIIGTEKSWVTWHYLGE